MTAGSIPRRYLQVELPDKTAVIDFMGKYGVSVRLELDKDQLWVKIIACDDRAEILEDKVYEVPEADTTK